MKTKVLAFDIDGTLARSRQSISKEMAKLLEVLQYKYELVFITGGDLNLIEKQVLSQYEIKKLTCVFPTSGAQCFIVSTSGKLYDVYIKHLSSWDKVNIFSTIKEMVSVFNIQPLTDYNDMVDDRNTQINFSLTGRSANIDDKEAYDPDMKKRLEIIKYFKDSLPSTISMYAGGTTSIDFLQSGISKGTALKDWMQKRKLNKEEVTFFGDRLETGGNDSSVIGVCKTISVKSPEETLKILNDEYF